VPLRRAHACDAIWSWGIWPLFLTALPIALWKLTGNPLPSQLWSMDDVRTWWATVQQYPSQALDLLPRIVVDTLWIGWAWYSAWFTLAVAWTLLRLPGLVLPRLLLHLTPRTTVQAITAGAVAATPAAHAAPAVAHTTTAALPEHLTGRLHLVVTAQRPTALRPNHPASTHGSASLAHGQMHTVEPGDTLWDLAVRYYGDGEAWHRIYGANRGQPQPDGRALSDPDLILPGWQLTIPAAPAPGAPGPAHSPAGTASGRAHGLTPPAVPEPAHTRGPAPAPPGDGPGAHRPAAGPRTPHTVGWHPSGGGYVAITLLAALATAVALLRTRQRLRPEADPKIPRIAEQLAAVHDAAKAADAYGYLPDEHPDQAPPPVYNPQDGQPILGVGQDGQAEDWFTPAALTGPLIYQGPCAEDAVRAFALSLLAANPPGARPGYDVILTDQALAAELLGATPDQHIPGRLRIHPAPAAALATFQRAAERRAADHADLDPGDHTATAQDPDLTLILRADPALHPAITIAQRADPVGSLAAILLGALPNPDEHTTVVTLDQDGTVTHASGPDAWHLRGLTAQHLPAHTAAALFQTLHTARTRLDPTPREPATTAQAAPEPAQTPSTQAATSAPTATPPTSKATPAGQAPGEPTDAVPARSDAHTVTPAPSGYVAEPADPRILTDIPLLLRVLGPLDILGTGDPVPITGDRTATLLAALALHPGGLTTDQLAELAWDTPPARRDGASPVHTALTRARTLLRTALPNDQNSAATGRYIVKDPARRFHLDPKQITTDLALLHRLEQQAQHATDRAERRRLLTAAVQLYRGPLADSLGDSAQQWLATARQHTATRIARLHLALADVAGEGPHTAVQHLSAATRLATGDPHITATAMRTYHRLGRDDLARTTYREHERELETLGIRPDREIARLAAETLDQAALDDRAAQPTARHTQSEPRRRPRR
jgi:DNA-binding SARP family transcriptional activator